MNRIKRIEIKFPPSGKQSWSCACEQSVSEAGPQWVCAWSWETRISSLPTPRPRRVSQTLGRRRRDDVGDVRHGDQQTAAGFSGENQPLGWSEDSRQATRWDSPFKMFMFRLKCIIIVIFYFVLFSAEHGHNLADFRPSYCSDILTFPCTVFLNIYISNHFYRAIFQCFEACKRLRNHFPLECMCAV